MFVAYLAVAGLTIVMMWPIYDKFSWEQYQLIGLDEGLQKAFRVIQLAKSTFLIFFLLSAIQFVNLIYFETDTTRIVIFALLAIIMLVAIRLGYLAVRLDLSAPERKSEPVAGVSRISCSLHRDNLRDLPAEVHE